MPVLVSPRLSPKRLGEIDKLLLTETRQLRVRPAAMINRRVGPDELKIWCIMRAVYGLPTTELVEYLRDILGRDVLEIGAGNGVFGRTLGWKMTDNRGQEKPEVAMYYASVAQPTISYGEDVEEMDALKAVQKYKPKVVFGSWITHWMDPNKPGVPEYRGLFGVKEDEILGLVDTYCMYGNESTHADKPLLQLPHRTLKAPWMLSRAFSPHHNCLFIWSKDACPGTR